MSVLFFALIVLIVVAMLCYAVQYLPLAAPFDRLIMALIIIIGAFMVAQRAGIV